MVYTAPLMKPKDFVISSEKIIATYDWYDAGLGAGYKAFYGCAQDLAAGASYFLTTNTAINAIPDMFYSAGVQDFDFELEFINPSTISGDAIFNCSVSVDANHTVELILTYYHVDADNNATQIGTDTSGKDPLVGSVRYYKKCMKTTLAETLFKAGEKLRINVNKQDDGHGTLYFDPAGRRTFSDATTSATINSQMVFNIPFKIEL